MGENRVPEWYAATGLHGENERVYQSFRELLHQLPMSYTELAARIGVSQPAISRWAADHSHPSLDEMSAAYAAVDSRLGEIRECLNRFGEVLRLIDESLQLYESLPEVDSERREATRRAVTQRLRATLELSSDSHPG